MMSEGRWTASGDCVSLYFFARSKCLLESIQIDCKVFPRPISKIRVILTTNYNEIALTIAENPVKLVLSKEC